MKETEGRLNEIYSTDNADQWAESKTMEHASGIWGRDPMLKYLQEKIVKTGDKVVDLGSGGGYPTLKVGEMVGPGGSVIGVEYAKAQLGLDEDQKPITEKSQSLKNVSFVQGDIRDLPLRSETIDAGVSFMVLHNLDIESVGSVFKEVSRVLKPRGQAVFLTMHPEILDSEEWDMDFMTYDQDDLKKYHAAEDKEGIEVRGKVKNVSGGEKPIFMYHHTRKNIEKAIQDSGLTLTDAQDFWIDEKTAVEKFGKEMVNKVPTKPAFWMITVEK